MSDQRQVYIQHEYDQLITKVRDGDPVDAQKALLHLLGYMNDPDRFVVGARLYDSFIRDLIEESYSKE